MISVKENAFAASLIGHGLNGLGDDEEPGRRLIDFDIPCWATHDNWKLFVLDKNHLWCQVNTSPALLLITLMSASRIYLIVHAIHG